MPENRGNSHHGDPDTGAPLTLILPAAPLFRFMMTRLPTPTRTSSPGHLWFAALAARFLVGAAVSALGIGQRPGWVVPGLFALIGAFPFALAPAQSRTAAARSTTGAHHAATRHA